MTSAATTSVSIAKAGIICTLNARTSILASANPRESRYNPNLSVVENIDLPPTLLSRFDLIYLVLDKPNRETDSRLARHLVSLYFREVPRREAFLQVETLTAYIAYARSNIHPEITYVCTYESGPGRAQVSRSSAQNDIDSEAVTMPIKCWWPSMCECARWAVAIAGP